MYTVDPTFSAFGLIGRTEQQRIQLNHRRTMSLISAEIENATLRDGAVTRIFAGFQYLSKFTAQVKRYERIAARAESVYVFGVQDVTPPSIPKMIYIPLSSRDQLAREWFVISHGVDYSSALATKEVSEINDPDDNVSSKAFGRLTPASSRSCTTGSAASWTRTPCPSPPTPSSSARSCSAASSG